MYARVHARRVCVLMINNGSREAPAEFRPFRVPCAGADGGDGLYEGGVYGKSPNVGGQKWRICPGKSSNILRMFRMGRAGDVSRIPLGPASNLKRTVSTISHVN